MKISQSLEIIVETQNLVKFYGKKSVVHDLNLKVPKGGIYGFLGPNGAGKSTTIKMLLGLLRPTSGRIFLFNHEIYNHKIEIMSRIGYLPENPILYEQMTVINFIKYLARLHGVRNNLYQRSLEMLDFFGVGRHAFSECRELSAGQRQRVGLAQAFVHDPEFIILDEPTTNLDPLGRLQIFEKLRQLVEEEEKTVFVSSHILQEVERLCDHIGIIDQGKLVTSQPLGDIISQTTDHEYVIVVDRPQQLISQLRTLPYFNWIREKEFQIVVNVEDGKTDQFKEELLQLILKDQYQLKSFKPLYMPIEKVFIDALGIRSTRELENVTE